MLDYTFIALDKLEHPRMYKGLMDGCLKFFSITAYECESWKINYSVKKKIEALLYDSARKSCISSRQMKMNTCSNNVGQGKHLSILVYLYTQYTCILRFILTQEYYMWKCLLKIILEKMVLVIE